MARGADGSEQSRPLFSDRLQAATGLLVLRIQLDGLLELADGGLDVALLPEVFSQPE